MRGVYRRLKACQSFPSARVQLVKDVDNGKVVWEAIYEVYEPTLRDWFVVEYIRTLNEGIAQREFEEFIDAASIKSSSKRRRSNDE